MKQRTQQEHAEWFFEFLLSHGHLHTHLSEEEFVDIYLTGLVDDEKEDGLEEIITSFQSVMANAREPNRTAAREEDRITSIPRKKRREKLLEKWPKRDWGEDW